MVCKLGTKPLRVCSVQTIFGLGDALSLMACILFGQQQIQNFIKRIWYSVIIDYFLVYNSGYLEIYKQALLLNIKLNKPLGFESQKLLQGSIPGSSSV